MGYQFHFELLNEGPLDFSGQLHPCDAMKKKNLCREERKTERKKERKYIEAEKEKSATVEKKT